MNNRSGMMAVDPLYAQPLHQFRVSGRHTYPIHFCHDAVSADLLDIRHAAPVDFFTVCPLQAPADGMRRSTLRQCRVLQQLFPVHLVMVDFIDFKHTLGQSAGLVKHNILRL